MTRLNLNRVFFQLRFLLAFSFAEKSTASRLYSCPRDSCLSASWGPQFRAPWNPSDCHRNLSYRGVSGGVLNWSPIMPRGTSLSDNGCFFFFPVRSYHKPCSANFCAKKKKLCQKKLFCPFYATRWNQLLISSWIAVMKRGISARKNVRQLHSEIGVNLKRISMANTNADRMVQFLWYRKNK